MHALTINADAGKVRHVDPVYLALVAAGMGAFWWRHMRNQRKPRALATVFDGDAEVVLHVAARDAQQRGVPMSSLHVLYGLLQDETITRAVRDAGADPAGLEDRVLAALDRAEAAPDAEDAQRVYAHAAGHAHHANRLVGATDLWAYLRQSQAAALLEGAGISVSRVLFQLCHGTADPEATTVGAADVHVILRNDDYTTQQFVCHVLEDVFALSNADAVERMMQTHLEGKAIVGRFRAADAREKIDLVRERARASGFPLWIGTEPS